jgi:hypothetical protein
MRTWDDVWESESKDGEEKDVMTVQDVYNSHYDAYCLKYRPSKEQAEVARHIMLCRTAALGGRIRMCAKCGEMVFHFNSCKDRHCPLCGSYEKGQWLAKQGVWVLPIPYYQGVFTISHELNGLVKWNRKLLYNELMKVVGEVLKEYGKRYLGGEIGVTMVLHTWGQQMQYHVHVHCIITGGALVESDEGYRWQKAKETFLFPVKELSATFRERLCERLRKLVKAGKVVEPKEGLDMLGVIEKAQKQAWEVYLERPFSGVEKLLDYLGRYIFRVAIGNYRIAGMNGDKVRFRYQDNRDEGKEKVLELSGVEFIRRHLEHVLPKGFMRVRQLGLHHSACRKKLSIARVLLGESYVLPVVEKVTMKEWVAKTSGDENAIDRCPNCGSVSLVTIWEFGRIQFWRLVMGSFLVRLIWQFGWGGAPAH